MGIASLEIGRRALLAQRFGLDVTSNNIANSNTAGYSRREATFSEANPYYENGNFNGNGVVVDKLRSYREDFFDKEVRNSVSRQKSYENDDKIVQRLETILAEPSELGISEVTSKFLTKFDELALKPESLAHREELSSLGQTLVDRINSTASQIKDARIETLQSMSNNVDQANSLINEIAGLNKAFSGNKPEALNDAQTMIDQREQKLEELSKLFNIGVTNNNDGTINAFIGGINVVNGAYSSKLAINENVNSITGERTAKVVKVDENNSVINVLNPDNGEIASQLKHYNITLDESDSTSSFSLATEFNTFVQTLAKKVNDLTSQGYGIGDQGLNPPGRSFFESTTGPIDMFTIKVNDEIKADPRKLPISDKANESGNAKIAVKLARIADDSTFLKSSTPSQFYAQLTSKLGNAGQEAANGLATTKLVSEQLVNQRESIIGVNVDEEAVNLIKFQQAFQASSRIINTTNELLTTIVNLGK